MRFSNNQRRCVDGRETKRPIAVARFKGCRKLLHLRSHDRRSSEQDTALIPFDAAVSKPAQKAYLGTAFFAITTIFLLCVASAAYWIFYFSYIPQVGIDRVIHLQFGSVFFPPSP